jgi:RND family efflux transporter MFP subunit
MKIWLLAGISIAFLSTSSLAGEWLVMPETRPEFKAVFGQVESRDVVPARARLGGTIVSLAVEEGSAVPAGAVLATIVDDKLALQLQAGIANISSIQAQLDNAQTELARVKKLSDSGIATKAALDATQTQYDVVAGQLKAAQASKAVLEQQAAEGKVLAPAAGRVLSVPVTKGSVVMAGEPVAQLASGQYYLRLALPERHAPKLKEGAVVQVGAAVGATDDQQTAINGKMIKIYPQIEAGKVIADVQVDGLGDYFVGQRVLVRIPVDERQVISVPSGAVFTRHGIDYVKLSTPSGVEVPVITGESFDAAGQTQVEILSGLAAGDKVATP